VEIATRTASQAKETMEKLKEDISIPHINFSSTSKKSIARHSGGHQDWTNRPGQFYSIATQSNWPSRFCYWFYTPN
jgi:hypothetical protein